MRGQNIWFRWEIKKIIIKYSLLSRALFVPVSQLLWYWLDDQHNKKCQMTIYRGPSLGTGYNFTTDNCILKISWLSNKILIFFFLSLFKYSDEMSEALFSLVWTYCTYYLFKNLFCSFVWKLSPKIELLIINPINPLLLKTEWDLPPKRRFGHWKRLL